MVEVDLDHQRANNPVAVTHGSGKEVATLGRGGALAEEAPQAPGDGFTEVGTEGEVAANETVVFIPVGGGQGVAVGVHQVHDFGAGLGGDVLEQAVGVGQGFQAQRVGQHGAQGWQVAEDLRQGFVAVQGAEQVGHIEIEGLAVLPGQLVLVVALGEVLQWPQQWRQAHCKYGQAAPARAAGYGWSYVHRNCARMIWRIMRYFRQSISACCQCGWLTCHWRCRRLQSRREFSGRRAGVG
ncbi:hypothetical protein D3C81_574830 [compost metagenome]